MTVKKAQKNRVPARKDQVNFNMNGTEYPDLFEQFSELLALYGGDRSAVLRELGAAWTRFGKTHKRPPRFPLTIVEADDKKK